MLSADREIYNSIRELVSTGKYYEAYRICITHHCKDQILSKKFDCAKHILKSIVSFRNMQNTSFKWFTSFSGVAFVPIIDYEYRNNLRFLKNQISEIKSLLEIK